MYCCQNGLWPEEVSGFGRSTIADKITPFEPIRNVTPDWPPTLLIHGTRDTDVPYEQSELMEMKFKQKGVRVTAASGADTNLCSICYVRKYGRG
jgi:hypothetical protein